MGLTSSVMLPLNTIAPDFNLLNVMNNQHQSLKTLKGKKGTLIMFICNHCPYVKHVQEEIVNIANHYQKEGITVLAISANDSEQYPEDSPKKMKSVALELGYPFPYLYDETQMVAKAYQAVCTPDFFLFDTKMCCVYRGQLDDSRPGNKIPVSGKDLRLAIDNLLIGNPIDENQKPSIGCNIKWKKANE